MKYFAIIHLVLLLMLAPVRPGKAVGLTDNAANYALLGIVAELQSGPRGYALLIRVDREKMASVIPIMQLGGALAPNVSEAEIRLKPTTYTLIVATLMAPEIVRAAFEEHDAMQAVRVAVSMKHADAFGNDAETPLMSFNFNRALYQKINWPKFDTLNMSKIAPDFRYSPEGQMLMRLENR
jgi:hypothetical protein